MQDLEKLIETIKNSPTTLFILCGFPYAGKSYVASEVLQQTDMALVSIDNIFHARGFNWDSNKLPNATEWEQIFDESYKLTKEALAQGRNVLYDSTNQTLTSRDRLRTVAQSVDAKSKVIYLKSTPETVWERWKENKKNPSRPLVSEELVQMTIDAFEEPTESESVIIINN